MAAEHINNIVCCHDALKGLALRSSGLITYEKKRGYLMFMLVKRQAPDDMQATYKWEEEFLACQRDPNAERFSWQHPFVGEDLGACSLKHSDLQKMRFAVLFR